MGDTGDLPVIAASEVIGMDDDPGQGVRRKKDSSLVRAAEAVRDGTAMAMVSAGNTGATMASALLRMGRLPGVHPTGHRHPDPRPRSGPGPPCCSTRAPTPSARRPMLVQFAQMGAAFARQALRGGATPGRAAVDRRGEVQGDARW